MWGGGLVRGFGGRVTPAYFCTIQSVYKVLLVRGFEKLRFFITADMGNNLSWGL